MRADVPLDARLATEPLDELSDIDRADGSSGLELLLSPGGEVARRASLADGTKERALEDAKLRPLL